MATSSTFSYAQAAKGQGSNSLSNATSQAKDALPASSVGPQTTSAIENSIESIDANQDGNVAAIAADKQDVTSNNETETQSESARGTHRDPTRDDDTNRLDRPWRQNDKGTRSSSTTTRSVDEQDSRRQRRSKKTKGSDKTSNEQTGDKDQEAGQEPPKVELSEAPIPSVNIWQQRKEAQLAKVKPSATTTSEQTVDSLANGVAATKLSEDGAAPQSTKDQAANGAKSHKRPADAARPERNTGRGSRIAEREARENRNDTPPLVSDAAAWPTPEIAIREDKKKPSDKTERAEKEKEATEDGAQSKPRSKEKWVAYDYVPTVNFETQLPQMRNSKARGSSRTVNSRRDTSTAGEKTTTASTQQNKTNESRDRRSENAAGASRATMSPSTSKRTPETAQPREQKKPAPNPAVTDKPKETTPTPNEQGPPVRERPEGRNERGRGGFRGRGGHYSVNSHHQQHTGTGFVATGPMPPRAQGPYSPPNRQIGHGQGYIPQQRGGRAGRNNAGNNFHRMSMPNGTSRLPPVQAHYRGYEYPMATSAMPFQAPAQLPQHQPQHQPYWDNIVMPVLKNQIEYYFSIENLCKDMYLRARMDSQGFVPLPFVAAFKRVRDLSADIGIVRAVCEMSTEIDFVIGDDDIERVRRREGWEKFVLPLEDRDEFARNHGPSRLIFRNRAYQLPPQFNGMTTPYSMTSPPIYPTHTDMPYQQMPDEMAGSHSFNGHINGNEAGHGMTSQLSADVPDFAPSGSIPQLAAQSKGLVVNGQIAEASHHGLTNGVHSASPQSVQGPSQS